MASHDTSAFLAAAERLRPQIDAALDRATNLSYHFHFKEIPVRPGHPGGPRSVHSVALSCAQYRSNRYHFEREVVSDAPAPKLLEAMRYSLLLPGKRIRPILTLLAAEVCGGSIERALPAAVAIEMVHAFSLIHDDLPAMDNDDLRRGKPTNHKVFGEAQAILAGDALLNQAFAVLANELSDAEISRSCMRELSQATGAHGMTGGQSIDMEARVQSLEGLDQMHQLKTGALIVCALRMGAITASVSCNQLDALTIYGKNLGLAFQIMDDVLDVTGSTADTGKTAGKDQTQKKVTYPALIGIEESKKRAEDLVKQGIEMLSVFGAGAEGLRGLGWSCVRRGG